jgi:predicted RecA/RadA family phage recombinase
LTHREKSVAQDNASRYSAGKECEMAKQSARKRPRVETDDTTKGAMMHDTKKAQELFTQGSGRAVETMTLWADANQRVLRELAELSAATAKEGVRLYAELQQAGIEALRDAQATSLRWQSTWQEAPRDPLAWYQRALTDGVEHTQKWFRILEGNAQAVTRTAERLQTTAEQAGKGIQESFSETVTKMKDVYAA